MKLGPSQKKVLNFLDDELIRTATEIGIVVGGKDLTGRNTRGANWAYKVLKPLIEKGLVKKHFNGGYFLIKK